MTSPRSASEKKGSRRVLVIEDNEDSAECLLLLLESAGHEVVVAATAREGVETAMRFRPDIVLCDIGLGGDLSGHDVARSLKSDPRFRGCTLIALTGYSQAEVRQRALDSGFDLFMTKPIDPPVLMELLAGIPGCDRREGEDS